MSEGEGRDMNGTINNPDDSNFIMEFTQIFDDNKGTLLWDSSQGDTVYVIEFKNATLRIRDDSWYFIYDGAERPVIGRLKSFSDYKELMIDMIDIYGEVTSEH